VIQKLTKELVEEANKPNKKDGDAFGVVGHYEKCYKKKYGNKPYVNLHKYKYMALEVLNGYKDYEKVKLVIEHYFTIQKENHPIEWMLSNFDKLMTSYDNKIKDQKLREERRKETARIKQEWLNGNA